MARLLLVVTGASRGLGRAISVAFSKSSVVPLEQIGMILIARSAEGLRQTENEVLTQRGVEREVEISCKVVDLGDLEVLETDLETISDDVSRRLDSVDRFVFVNNAGSLGHVGRCADTPSLDNMRKAVDLNVTSALWLSARFARLAVQHPEVKTTIVNISSLVAVQPFPTMGIYSAGKAARDSYHSVLAQEHESQKHLRFLSYAPGPLETEMADTLRQAEDLDPTLKSHFHKQFVDPVVSACTLVKVVLGDSFESGQHIDYFDQLRPSP